MGDGVTPDSEGPSEFSAPQPLSGSHGASAFDCGNPELNHWLQNTAPGSEGKSARTYVVVSQGQIAGYYCLAAGAVFRKNLPTARTRRNTPSEVPVIVLGRLATDSRFQNQGIGGGMLKDAISRAIESSKSIGIRAVVVHAIDDDAIAYYLGFGFLPSPIDRRTLVLPIETAIAALP